MRATNWPIGKKAYGKVWDGTRWNPIPGKDVHKKRDDEAFVKFMNEEMKNDGEGQDGQK